MIAIYCMWLSISVDIWGFSFWPDQISVYARIEHFFVFAFSFSLNTTKESQLYTVLSQDPIIFIKVFSAARDASNLEHVCEVFLKCVFKFFQEFYNLIDIFFMFSIKIFIIQILFS